MYFKAVGRITKYENHELMDHFLYSDEPPITTRERPVEKLAGPRLQYLVQFMVNCVQPRPRKCV